MRALLPAMLLMLIILVDSGTASSQGWRELMDRKRWESLKTFATKKDMVKGYRELQQNFSTSLNEVEGKLDQMKEGFLSFGLLFANLLTNIQEDDVNGNNDSLTPSEDTLGLSEENSGDIQGQFLIKTNLKDHQGGALYMIMPCDYPHTHFLRTQRSSIINFEHKCHDNFGD